MQVEMAASGEQATPPSGADSSGGRASGSSSTVEVAATLAKVNAEVQSMTVASDKSSSSTAGDSTQDNERPKQKEFKDLTSVEMMDVLTRNLLKWQQEFGKYGDK